MYGWFKRNSIKYDNFLSFCQILLDNKNMVHVHILAKPSNVWLRSQIKEIWQTNWWDEKGSTGNIHSLLLIFLYLSPFFIQAVNRSNRKEIYKYVIAQRFYSSAVLFIDRLHFHFHFHAFIYLIIEILCYILLKIKHKYEKGKEWRYL